MSYWDIADMAGNLDLQARIYACSAQETGTTNGIIELLVICGAPGWADAWASALASENPQPGKDPGVITDPQILAEVQKYLADQATDA